MDNMNEALSLLLVGMIMVLIILFLVVVIGNVVIQLTNRYIPAIKETIDEEKAIKSITSKKMAVLAAVVDVVTQGRGKVDSVQKK